MLDETSISVESNNYSSWSPVGQPPILEKNASHEGTNIIGATDIKSYSYTTVDVYDSNKSITSSEVIDFLKHLIEINPQKRTYVIWDNAKIHTSKAIKKFITQNSESIATIRLPRYSPYMNPQENIWSWFKSKMHRNTARRSIDELVCDASTIIDELNSNKDRIYKDRIYSLANARNFLL